MLEIRPSSDLRNKYNKISQFCHENGKGNLAIMSITKYENWQKNRIKIGLKATENDKYKWFSNNVHHLKTFPYRFPLINDIILAN